MSSIRIRTEGDAAEAARLARETALACGLSPADAVALATAVSEVAGNQLRHAGATGTVEIVTLSDGVLVEATDAGPGIADVDRALDDGFSTAGGSLGLGLPGARRLVDDFVLRSSDAGTVVRMVKRLTPLVPEPGRLVSWAVAGSDARMQAVVQHFRGGLTLAIACPDAAARVLEHPASPPARLLGEDGVVATLSALDGQLTWQRAGLASGRLLRARGEAVRTIAEAPMHRAATIGVRRDDLVLLAACAPVAVPEGPWSGAGELAASVSDACAGAHVLSGRIERGVLERRSRPDA